MAQNDGIDPKGFDFFAAVVSQQAANAADATNALLAVKDQQLHEMSQAFMDFYNVVDECADTVTSRRLEAAIKNYGGWYYTADLHVNPDTV